MRRAAILIPIALLTACGQAGDLYLPDPAPGVVPEPEEDVTPFIPEPEERKPGRPQGS